MPSWAAAAGRPAAVASPWRWTHSRPIGEGAIIGRGSKITVQNQMPQIHAGLGSAFSFEVAGERFELLRNVLS